ncbi:MAG: cache domain-containing protein, partial [Sphaerochaetaceae bacterium]|nr:cache domain-containing protein [Sphaerochaetaceae bacterium]
MIIPLVVLSVYYVAAGNNAITKNLSDQNEMATVRIADQVKSIIESYRHKTYVLSTNNTIISELDADAPETSSSRSKEIYEQLFTIMRGDTYLASATIVSSSGQARYSTHLFPSRYDIRYNRNDWNPFFTLSRTAGENASVITIENRYATQTNAFVFMSIYRKVRNTAGEEVGYVAVDIFQEALSSLNNWFRFNEIILIDTDNFLASSLLTTDRFGDFSNFPELRSIQAPFTRKTITDSSM